MRATSQTVGPAVAADPAEASVTTAEIPTVGTTRAIATVGALATNPNRYVLQPRPDPAPASVRLLVWVLVFVFIVLAVGLLAAYFHPTWFSILRHTTRTPHALGAVLGGLTIR